MAAQLAFTAEFVGNQVVIAKAIVGLPGLAVDPQFGSFPTWTQANECARRLNEGLGLSQSQVREIVTEVTLAAQQLIVECQSLRETARQLRRRQYPLPAPGSASLSAPSINRRYYPELELRGWQAQLELGITFCQIACTRRDVRKEQLLQKARKVSNVTSAMGKFEFSIQGIGEINRGIKLLQGGLDECPPQE